MARIGEWGRVAVLAVLLLGLVPLAYVLGREDARQVYAPMACAGDSGNPSGVVNHGRLRLLPRREAGR